jgi:hypothetical protein
MFFLLGAFCFLLLQYEEHGSVSMEMTAVILSIWTIVTFLSWYPMVSMLMFDIFKHFAAYLTLTTILLWVAVGLMKVVGLLDAAPRLIKGIVWIVLGVLSKTAIPFIVYLFTFLRND